MAAKYIFGSKQFSSTVTKLSGTSRGLATALFSDPRKMESIISIVRTAAPLSSPQTVSKVNTYLPAAEKISTLLGMYSFLSKAQNYSPIQSLNAKTPMEKVGALMKNNNMPIAKLMAQPVLKNQMEKVMTNAAKDMMKNGSLNEMLSSMAKQFSEKSNDKSNENSENNGNIDFNSLLETFMPLLNSITSDNPTDKKEEKHSKGNKNYAFKDESNLPKENHDVKTDEIHEERNDSQNQIHEQPKNSGSHQNSTPIHIRQRRRNK